MSFKDAKSKLLECLKSGYILHEERGNIDIKNLLSTGMISFNDVTDIIGRARGNNYSSSMHHFDSTIKVHIIKTFFLKKNWYIKWYFIEPNCVFISIHH